MTALVDTDTVELTSSAVIYAAAGATTCTAKQCPATGCNTATALGAGAAVTVTSASADATKKILTVTMGAGGAAAQVLKFNCTNNLAVNPAAGAVTFNVKTNKDAALVSGATGYTIVAAPTPRPPPRPPRPPATPPWLLPPPAASAPGCSSPPSPLPSLPSASKRGLFGTAYPQRLRVSQPALVRTSDSMVCGTIPLHGERVHTSNAAAWWLGVMGPARLNASPPPTVRV